MIDNNSIILGLDISTKNTGWSVCKYNKPNDYKMIAYSDIPRGKMDMEEVLVNFEQQIIDIIQKYKPTYISAESPFMGKNPDTTAKLCWLHGILQLVAKKNNIPITYYSVMTLKAKTLGHVTVKKNDGTKKTGKELKLEVMNKIIDIFNITDNINDDISDSMSAIYTFFIMDGMPIEKKEKKIKKEKVNNNEK